MKRLICIILGLSLFTTAFAGENLFSDKSASTYFNTSKLEYKLLYEENQNWSSRFLCLMNTEYVNNLTIEKIEKPLAKKGLFYASLSPAVLPGISLGYGWINYDKNTNSCNEIIPNLHINSIGLATAVGISLLTNAFKNSNRKGFFFRTNIGVDYVVLAGGDPGGGVVSKEFAFPNFSLGGGYSIKIGRNSFFRISLDVGLKVLISNLNLSIIL